QHHPLQQLVTVVVVLIATAVQLTTSLTCYKCSDEPGDDYYDADCGLYDYRGHTSTSTYDGCYIYIYDDGYVQRTHSDGREDGQCYYGSDHTGCACTSSYCNTDSFCAQCGYPRPTPTTTKDTTTEQPTITTTAVLPSHTTDTTTLIPTNSPATVKCFQCIACGHVDDNTPISEDEYTSCVTTVLLESAKVNRGGSYKDHPDGECAQLTETLTCWCSNDLCNNISIEM
ncbi:unnamed protein product, partial [Meganyctiphanes norvegica]